MREYVYMYKSRQHRQVRSRRPGGRETRGIPFSFCVWVVHGRVGVSVYRYIYTFTRKVRRVAGRQKEAFCPSALRRAAVAMRRQRSSLSSFGCKVPLGLAPCLLCLGFGRHSCVVNHVGPAKEGIPQLVGLHWGWLLGRDKRVDESRHGYAPINGIDGWHPIGSSNVSI